MNFTLFLMLNASMDWLRMPRAEREIIAEKSLARVLSGQDVKLRHFDAEAFHGRISDVAMIEAETADAAYFAIERLRDTALIAQGYFTVVDIVPAFEDGFRAFNRQDQTHAA